MFGSIWKRSSENCNIPKKKKNYNVGMWFNKKKIFEVSEFSILPCTQNFSEISESFILIKFLVVSKTQNQQYDLKEKTLTLQCGLRR